MLKALQVFICTDVLLSAQEILDRYTERCPMELFSGSLIRGDWLLMSLAHLIACTGWGSSMPFEDGYAFIHDCLQDDLFHKAELSAQTSHLT